MANVNIKVTKQSTNKLKPKRMIIWIRILFFGAAMVNELSMLISLHFMRLD